MLAGIFERSLPINLLLFALAGAGVWIAGTKLSAYADAFGRKLGIGQAFMGLVVLASATELPEIVTTASAAMVGNAPLAINNMFGGIVMQTAILSIADLTLAYGPLTFFTPRPVLLLQGTALIVLLALTQAAIVAGEFFTFFGVGMWPIILAALYVFVLYLLRRYEQSGQWRPVNVPDPAKYKQTESTPARHDKLGIRVLVIRFVAASTVVLMAGFVLARTADAIATQSGLGSSFVGATVLAASTSLPELSTTVAAIRLGAFSMAIANILGSNLIMVGLILPADIMYRPGPILEAVDRPAMFIVTVGIIVTAVYLMGLIERRNKQVLRMGYDSIVVLAVYIASIVALFFIR